MPELNLVLDLFQASLYSVLEPIKELDDSLDSKFHNSV